MENMENTNMERMEKRGKMVNAAILMTVIALFLVVIMAFYFVLISLMASKQNIRGSLSIDENAAGQIKEVESNPLEGRYVELVGFDDMELKKGDTVSLSNPSSNGDFLLKYTLKNEEDGKLLFESELIPSGKSVSFMVGEDMEEGDYRIAFEQNPYWENPETGEYEPLTGGINVVNVKIGE